MTQVASQLLCVWFLVPGWQNGPICSLQSGWQPQAPQGAESATTLPCQLRLPSSPGARVSVSPAQFPCSGCGGRAVGRATTCLGPFRPREQVLCPILMCWSGRSCVGSPL